MDTRTGKMKSLSNVSERHSREVYTWRILHTPTLISDARLDLVIFSDHNYMSTDCHSGLSTDKIHFGLKQILVRRFQQRNYGIKTYFKAR